MVREKKSFRKFATKHLAGVIERRRKTAKGRKEHKERSDKKKVRDAKMTKKEDEEHAADVAKLQETDPEFFSFLETEDPTLLEYGRIGLDEGDDEDEFGIGGDDDDDDDDDGDARPKKSKKLQKRTAASVDDGLDDISDSDTDVDDDDDEDDAGDDDLIDAELKAEKKSKLAPADAAAAAAAAPKVSSRISAAELEELTRTKNMQDAVNIFVCAAKELQIKDLKISTNANRPDEAKLISRKFENPSLVKEAMFVVARMVASGAAAALIGQSSVVAPAGGGGASAATNADGGGDNNNQQQDAASGATLSKNQKKKLKKQQQKSSMEQKKNSADAADGAGVQFVHARARAIVSRYITTAAAVLVDVTSSDESLAAVIAHSLRAFTKVMHTIRGATKRVLRACFALCTATLETARSAGLMVILAVAKRSAGTHSLYQSSLFKGLFLTLIRACSQYTARSMGKVGFLLNAMVELYGTDLEAAYQHAFVYIRQLAVYLRAALQDPSQPSNLRTVCNWQYLIALRTWAFVVSTYHESKQLGPLVHPVVQIALGVIDVFASPRMVPLHLHVVETLNHIASRARVFIPVAPHLMRIITAPAHALGSSMSAAQRSFQNKNDNKNDNNKNTVPDSSFTDLQYMLRVKKAYARSSEYILNVWLETLYLLAEHLAHLSTFIGFYEASWQVQTSLNKLKREVKVPKIHALISNIVRNIDESQKNLVAKRSKVNFGPCDVQQVKLFEDQLVSKGTAMTAYYSKLRSARLQDFAAKQKALFGTSSASAAAAAADSKKNKDNNKKKDSKKKADHDDDDDDGDDIDEGLDEEDLQAMGAAEQRSGHRRKR